MSINDILHARDGQRQRCPWCQREMADEADDRACCDAAEADGRACGGEGEWLCWANEMAGACEGEDSYYQRERAEKAEERVAELEELLRKHAAIACSECHGTGCYLGDEDRDWPCDACGGSGAVLPADVVAVLGGGGR